MTTEHFTSASHSGEDSVKSERLPKWLSPSVSILMGIGALAALGISLAALRLPTITVMAVGDSLTYGERGDDHTSIGGYRTVAADILGNRYDWVGSEPGGHEGFQGWEASTLCALLPGWLNEFDPKVVVIMAGANDFGLGRPNRETVQSIEGMIVASRGRRVIVMPVPYVANFKGRDGDAGINTLDEAIKAMCQRRGAEWLETRGLLTASDIGGDGGHLNNSGYAKLGKVVAQALRESN